MSVGKKTIQYTAAAVIFAAVIMAASFLYLGVPSVPASTNSQTGSSTTAIAGPTSTLVIQLTDPPQVPSLTSSLNLTYSSLGILVGEPSTAQGQETTSRVTITPQGGNATLDLLKLQNLSQTLASATLPNDSVIYSVTFNVTSITINVNGNVSKVALVSGSSSLTVTIADPTAISGTNVALLQLNPVVVDTPTGYQMIPSAVGILQHDHGQGESQVGSQHALTHEDFGNLSKASGNATLNLLEILVSQNVTTVKVQVNNTGTLPIVINGIGVHGNFTTLASACQSSHTGDNSSQNSGDNSSQTSSSNSGHGSGDNHTETVTTNTTNTQGDSIGYYGPSHDCLAPEHSDQVVFVPVSVVQSTSSASCSSGNMTLVNGEIPHEQSNRSETLNPGECVTLTFSGVISFGESQMVLVPSTLAGQAYGVSLIASNGANQQISCVLPIGPGSCATAQQDRHSDN